MTLKIKDNYFDETVFRQFYIQRKLELHFPQVHADLIQEKESRTDIYEDALYFLSIKGEVASKLI